MTPEQREEARKAVDSLNANRDLTKLRESLWRMNYLATNNAPPTVKAHYLVRVLLPRLYHSVGVEAVAEQLASMLAYGACTYSGICTNCKKLHADPDSGYKLCPRCHEAQIEFEKRIDQAFEQVSEEDTQ